MKTIETYTLPSHWASALINNNWSGLDEKEQGEVHYWLANNNCPDFVEVSEDTFFSKYNDADTLACDCAEYKAFTN